MTKFLFPLAFAKKAILMFSWIGRAAALVLVGAPIMAIAGSSQAQNAGSSQPHNAGPSRARKALKIVIVPKFTGAVYFAATEKGAKEAVAELKEKGVDIDFLYTGPSAANTDEQIRMIDDLVAQKPDAIIIAASDADATLPVVKKAKSSGIKVITYDGDVADPTARQWSVNQGTFAEARALNPRRIMCQP